MAGPRRLPTGVAAMTRGTVSVAGPALDWLRRFDAAVVESVSGWGATEVDVPPVIDAADLERIDYFRSFPHLLTVPASLPPTEDAAQRFVNRCARRGKALPMEELAPIEHALLPAACYQVYPRLRATQLAAAALVTTKATCFRREASFEPLRRQWSFSMREAVCVGAADEVTGFLERGRDLITALCVGLDLRHDWAMATDPFFQPARHARYLYQRLNPVKHETVVDDLAVASINRHYEHFADAFGITRDGQPAQSGCVAFGLERWLSVMSVRWGHDPVDWPDPTFAAVKQ